MNEKMKHQLYLFVISYVLFLVILTLEIPMRFEDLQKALMKSYKDVSNYAMCQ